jgi:hypothetical protein
MLQKVDISKIKERSAASISTNVVVSKESQTLDFIKKMKREKALKILRAYRRYKFKKCLRRLVSTLKVFDLFFTKFYIDLKMLQKI